MIDPNMLGSVHLIQIKRCTFYHSVSTEKVFSVLAFDDLLLLFAFLVSLIIDFILKKYLLGN